MKRGSNSNFQNRLVMCSYNTHPSKSKNSNDVHICFYCHFFTVMCIDRGHIKTLVLIYPVIQVNDICLGAGVSI